MDRLLGSIIDDYTLYRITEGGIAILSLITIYLGIQIALTWKHLKKQIDDSDPDTIIADRGSFYRSSIFIFITGFFMLIHEVLEGLGNNATDFATHELFELIALSGLVLFLNEWRKILRKREAKIKSIE